MFLTKEVNITLLKKILTRATLILLLLLIIDIVFLEVSTYFQQQQTCNKFSADIAVMSSAPFTPPTQTEILIRKIFPSLNVDYCESYKSIEPFTEFLDLDYQYNFGIKIGVTFLFIFITYGTVVITEIVGLGIRLILRKK